MLNCLIVPPLKTVECSFQRGKCKPRKRVAEDQLLGTIQLGLKFLELRRKHLQRCKIQKRKLPTSLHLQQESKALVGHQTPHCMVSKMCSNCGLSLEFKIMRTEKSYVYDFCLLFRCIGISLILVCNMISHFCYEISRQ